MKASERLRKAAADPSIYVTHSAYFSTDECDIPYGDEGIVCVACAVGAMVACCEQPEIIKRVWDDNDGSFFNVVEQLTPHLLARTGKLECPLVQDHDEEEPGYAYVGLRYLNYPLYQHDIAHLVEHLFEDHRLDLTQIADLIEPMGY